MKIVFMGTPDFAVPSLVSLSENFSVAAVVTATDKPAGRGQKVWQPPVKLAAQRLQIPVLQPEKLKDPEFLAKLGEYQADLFVVVAFRMLPEAVWAMPPKGTINLHASLLPAYRGAAPINWAIMNGEQTTGLTTFFIEKDIDTGKVIAQHTIAIGPDEDVGSLHDRMMDAGAALLVQTAAYIASGKAKSIPQLEMGGDRPLPLAPKIFKEDCLIHWNRPARELHNHIRGLSPWPGAHALSSDGEHYKIYASHPSADPCHETPGTLKAVGSKLYVATSDSWLEIRSIQAPGRKRMDTAEFIRGWRMPEGFSFVP